jgi:phage protein U
MTTSKSGQGPLITLISLLVLCVALVTPCDGLSAKDKFESPGFVKEIEGSPQDVLDALNDDLRDQTIHGTYVFDKEPILLGATLEQSSKLFPEWTGGGQVFFKVRTKAIAPRHFLESADQGTIAVRFVLTTLTADRSRLRIDAIYVEDAHRTYHPSDGTVEAAEFKVIRDRVLELQSQEQEAADLRRRRDSAELVRQTYLHQREDETTRLATAKAGAEDLQQRVQQLRHEVDRRVKAPGADLKSAPFRESATIRPIAAYTEVVVLIITPHWIGVEEADGQRGWVPEDQLELLP